MIRFCLTSFLLFGFPLAAVAGICDWYDGSGVSKPGSCWALSAFNELNTTQRDCEDARSSDFAKKYGCAPGEEGSNNSGFGGFGFCSSNSNCFEMGALTQKAGLNQLNSLIGGMRADAAKLHDMQGKRLDAASSTLDRWQKNLGSSASQRQGDITGLNRDRDLVQKARGSYEGNGKFDANDANGAHDPGIKNNLQNFAYDKAGEEVFREEIKKRERDRDALLAMMNKTRSREGGLESLKDSSIGGRNPASLAGKRPGVGNGESENPDSSITGSMNDKLTAKRGGDKLSALTGKNIGEKGSDTDSKEASAFPERAENLRAQLREKLEQQRQAKGGGDEKPLPEALEGQSFRKELIPSSLRADDNTEAKNALLQDVISGGTAPPGAAGTGNFSLEGSETDREVKRFLHQVNSGGMDPSRQSGGGVLEKESTDLFQRVRQAHKHCLQRECVARITPH